MVAVDRRQAQKVLVLGGRPSVQPPMGELFTDRCELVEVERLGQAIEHLRGGEFDLVVSKTSDFLPLHRAVMSEQAGLVLDTIGEGVCIVDEEGKLRWSNRRLRDWPDIVVERLVHTCRQRLEEFSQQSPSTHPLDEAPRHRARKCAFSAGGHYFELIASPVVNPQGRVRQVVGIVLDATASHRLGQQMQVLDKAGEELVRLEAERIAKLNVEQRLQLLENKIIGIARKLLNFDNFTIRLLNPKTNKLEMAVSAGLGDGPSQDDLFASAEGNGISGYVAVTGRSYICPDIAKDKRYLPGMTHARSSLTVPLRLNDQVIGVFNVGSDQSAAFDEDDRTFAEFFARYVAIALNILNLLIMERKATSGLLTESVLNQVAGPLNDIIYDCSFLMEDYLGHDDIRKRLQAVLENVESIRKAVSQAGRTGVVGRAMAKHDEILGGKSILVVDDEQMIRQTISQVLINYGCQVQTAQDGEEAIRMVGQNKYDLILSDIKLPGKSGYDVFAAAKDIRADLPVILITGFGYDPNHAVIRARKEGLAAVLFKPFRVNELLKELRQAFVPA